MCHISCECCSISINAIHKNKVNQAFPSKQNQCILPNRIHREFIIGPSSIEVITPTDIDFIFKTEGVCEFRCRKCGAIFRIINDSDDQGRLQIIKNGHRMMNLNLNFNASHIPVTPVMLTKCVPLLVRKFFTLKKPQRSASLLNLVKSERDEVENSSSLNDWNNDTDYDIMFSMKRIDSLIGSFNPMSLELEVM